MVKRAVGISPSLIMIDEPRPTASDEPKLSVIIAWGMCSSRPRFTSVLHMTPDETMLSTEETS